MTGQWSWPVHGPPAAGRSPADDMISDACAGPVHGCSWPPTDPEAPQLAATGGSVARGHRPTGWAAAARLRRLAQRRPQGALGASRWLAGGAPKERCRHSPRGSRAVPCGRASLWRPRRLPATDRPATATASRVSPWGRRLLATERHPATASPSDTAHASRGRRASRHASTRVWQGIDAESFITRQGIDADTGARQDTGRVFRASLLCSRDQRRSQGEADKSLHAMSPCQ